jgi:hypothetical protein
MQQGRIEYVDGRFWARVFETGAEAAFTCEDDARRWLSQQLTTLDNSQPSKHKGT